MSRIPVLVLSIVVLAFSTTSVRAQSLPSVKETDSDWLPRPYEGLLVRAGGESNEAPSDRDRRIAELRRERAEISTEGPRRAIGAGTAMMVIGMAFVGGTFLGCLVECRTDVVPAFVLGGATLATIGGVTLASGVLVKSRREREREEIDRRILEIDRETARERIRLNARVDVGEVNGLTLSLSF